MDATPDHDLAAHVAAWHNRHPLARRITPAQVQGMGVVVLPFVASMGKKKGALRRAFKEDFIAPLGTRRVSHFTLRYGTSTRTGPEDWPQRELSVKPGLASADAEVRYLRTAAIDLRNQRTRVLIGGGKKPQVLGQRLWSRPRLAAAASVLGMALLIIAAALGRFSAPAQGSAAAVAASGPASAVTHALAASQAASGAVTEGGAPAKAASSADTILAAGSAPPNPPASSPISHSAPGARTASAAAEGNPATPAQSPPRDIRPALSSDQRDAARQEARALRASKSQDKDKASAASAASAGADGRTYAVATPVTRSRAAAQLRIVLMNAPTVAEPGQPHAEVMQTGSGWRTVVWPYPSRDAAERTRDSLAVRGIPAEVIEF